MLLANGWGAITGIRFGDRIGKGIRSSPRDALLADSLSSKERGRGFGLQRALDTAGAMVGLALVALIVYLIEGAGAFDMQRNTYHMMVLVGIFPAFIAVIILIGFVHDLRKDTVKNSAVNVSGSQIRKAFDIKFKMFLVIMTVFTLGNSSDFFLIPRAQNVQAPLLQIAIMLVVFNAVYAGVSTPMGVLSDKLGRRRVLALGWLIYGLVYLGFAMAVATWQIWLLFAVYGVYYGATQGVASAFIADLVPAERRGSAYGLFQGITGLALLPASILAGWLWNAVSPAATFYLGAGLALLAAMGYIYICERKEIAE